VVNELGDCPAASFGKGVQGQELVRADLIVSADPGIDRGATRPRLAHAAPAFRKVWEQSDKLPALMAAMASNRGR